MSNRLHLTRHQFVPLRKSKAELYENESPRYAWKLNALRAQIDSSHVNTSNEELVSLEEIMLDKDRIEEDSRLFEAYIMLDGSIEDKEDHESSVTDRTLVVKRANL